MSPPLLRRLGQVSMNVQDLSRATAFYRDQLGLPFLFAAGPMAFFDVGGTRLMLSLPESAAFDHPGSILYFDVADIAGTHRELAGRGVPFEGEPHVVAPLAQADLWMAFFRDTEGNLLALQCEVARG
jgi:catechol 2,3-dioxygenase-like lactoylglutathione lyase family enzyme